jgi:hypothetical protein
MPAFERGGLAFNYVDDGDPSGRPFVFQHGLGGDVSQPAGVFPPRRASGCSHWTAVATGERAPSAPRTSSPSRPSPTT